MRLAIPTGRRNMSRRVTRHTLAPADVGVPAWRLGWCGAWVRTMTMSSWRSPGREQTACWHGGTGREPPEGPRG